MAGRRIELGAGAGVVAAFDGLALLIAGEGSHDQLLDVVREASGSASSPGRGLARRLAALLTGDDADNIPAFGALGDAGDGLIVFLYGGVTATATDADGEQIELSGADAATWVDRVLPAGTGPVTLAPVGTEPGPTGFELGSGVVPGGWLRMLAEGAAAPGATTPPASAAPPPAPSEPAPAPPPPPAPPPMEEPVAPRADRPLVAPPADEEAPADETADMPVAFESFEITPEPDLVREPLPLDGGGEAATAAPEAPPAEEETVTEEDLVEGILCKRQHFNSPQAGFCSTCGISMVHQTHNLVRQKRPPLGFLVFDDGSTFTLDGRYVLGREPETDPLVAGGDARPIVLDDPQASVSRVHAEVRLEAWDVQLIDRGSTNGTHVWDPQRNAWDRLAAEQPRTVSPGERGAVGQRTFIYESPHRR